VPLVDGRRQSLQAVYRASAGAEAGERALAEGSRRLDDLLARLRVLWVQGRDMRRIPAWRRSFLNVNTPDVLRQALAFAAVKESSHRRSLPTEGKTMPHEVYDYSRSSHQDSETGNASFDRLQMSDPRPLM